MKPEAIDCFQSLLNPQFTELAGKVFAGLATQQRVFRAGPLQPTTLDENTNNHAHFDMFADDTEEGIQDNYALAEAARIVWRSRLRKRFPRKRFRLFVSNEYSNSPTTRKPVRATAERVDTVLRLWSLPADDSRFDLMYRPDDVGPGKVLWPEYRRNGLVGLSTVLAVIHASASHPAKLKTLKERWHAI